MVDESTSKIQPIHVKIKNFQSIEDISFTIHGFCVISGKTNIGKSAIMRAISSAMLGDSVIGLVRKGAPYCSVEMSSKDWGFRWEKGEKGINRYIIGDKTYDKPGQKQLEEIVKMGFGSVKLGSKEVQPWLASQFFPIFLLGETGSAVTDFISEVSRLTVLQDAVVLSSRGKKRSIDKSKESLEELQKVRDKLANVSGTDHIVKVAKELEEQKESIEEYDKHISKSDELHSKLNEGAQKITALLAVNSVRIPDAEAINSIDELRRMSSLWDRLRESVNKIIALRASEKMIIPVAPDEEWKNMSDGRRFLSIGHLQEKSRLFEGAEGIGVPTIPEGDGELSSIRLGESVKSRLLASSEAIRALSTDVEIPEPPSDSDKLRKGQELSERLGVIYAEESKLSDRMEEINIEIEEVNKQLAAIPACPSCGRPVASSDHNHSVMSQGAQ